MNNTVDLPRRRTAAKGLPLECRQAKTDRHRTCFDTCLPHSHRRYSAG